MKKHVLEFVKRGFMVASGGPMVLAIVYGILGAVGVIDSLAPGEVCLGILTITFLAFIASGITVVYTIERLPLVSAILIHAGVLYLGYLMIYLLNSWLPRDLMAVGFFTGIFVVGYTVIWVCIYLIIRKKTKQINQKLHQGA